MVMPSNPSLGNGFGHRGSTSNIGTSTVLSCAVAVFWSIDRPAPRPMTPAAIAAPYMKCRCCMSFIRLPPCCLFISPFATHELEAEFLLGPEHHRSAVEKVNDGRLE